MVSKLLPFKPEIFIKDFIPGLFEFFITSIPFFTILLVSPKSSIESPMVPSVTKSIYLFLSKLFFSIASITLKAIPTPAKFFSFTLQSSLNISTSATAGGKFSGTL